MAQPNGAAASSTPLLSDHDGQENQKPLPGLSQPQAAAGYGTTRRHSSQEDEVESNESTPLLEGSDSRRRESEPPTTSSKKQSRLRWPIIAALIVLCLAVTTILGLGFAAPEIVEQYAKEAVVFDATDLSVESITDDGVNARVRGNFRIDGSRVSRKPVRDLGRAATWIAHKVEAGASTVRVYLPGYDNLVLGQVDVPAIAVSVRDGEITPIDFVATVHPGDFDGIRRVATDWLDGKLSSLQVTGKADVGIKSGILRLGTQTLSHSILVEGKSIPKMPAYNIEKVNIHDAKLARNITAIAADVSATLHNDFPVKFTVPPMAFDILVPGCRPVGDLIRLANATTPSIDIRPKEDVKVSAQGVIRQVPDALIALCPGTQTSPLDGLLDDYIGGGEPSVFVRGAQTSPDNDAPEWLQKLLHDVVVPVPIPHGQSFKGLIRSFKMNDVHFELPDPDGEPGTPEGSPKLSALLKVVANLPKEMNFNVYVNRVRATAEVFYKKEKLGNLNIRDWQHANSTRIRPHGDVSAGIAIDAIIKDAPIQITNDTVFTEVIGAIVFGKDPVNLDIQAKVDVETKTVLGTIIAPGIPAEGKFPIGRKSSNNNGTGDTIGDILHEIRPQIGELKIVDTTPDTILIEANVNVTNPTNYSANVPYVDINILVNNTILGHATARNISMVPGRNENLLVHALWDPTSKGGRNATQLARQVMSTYISGRNLSISVQTHSGTFPSLPNLGKALSNTTITFPAPRLHPAPDPSKPHDPDDGDDGDDNDEQPHFITDATMHLLSSTATFVLLSPLRQNTLYITHLNATASLHDRPEEDPVGKILYDVPIAVPPGASKTPKLPVEWDVGSVGYDAIRDALGGRLKLDAAAEVGIMVGRWKGVVDYDGKGIGASVRL